MNSLPVRPVAGGSAQLVLAHHEDTVDACTPWEELVAGHFASVYRRAYDLTRHREDAEDLTQEVFIRVFRALPSYSPGTFNGWVYRITVNLYRDQVRRDRRYRLNELRDDAVDFASTRRQNPEELWADRIVDEDILAALAGLSPHYRTPLLLRYLDGLTYQEIASVLRIKCGTVGSRIHRGRLQLRTALAHRAASPTTEVSDAAA